MKYISKVEWAFRDGCCPCNSGKGGEEEMTCRNEGGEK